MDEDLFTFTACNERGIPVFTHQGFPSYNSTTTFHCACKKTTIDVPHNAITTPTGIFWRCKLPRNICGREYTFRLDYPVHVPQADESISARLIRIEDAIYLLQQSLRAIEARLEVTRLRQPIRDVMLRPEDPLAVIERAMRQPTDTLQLRQDLSDAFVRLEERMYDMQQEMHDTQQDMQESLERLNDRADDAVRKAERTLKNIKAVQDATVENGDALQGLQMDVGAIANLEQRIQQIDPNGGVMQLQPTLFMIQRILQDLQASINVRALADTCETVTEIREMLRTYNKRYDKSIGVIIG